MDDEEVNNTHKYNHKEYTQYTQIQPYKEETNVQAHS